MAGSAKFVFEPDFEDNLIHWRGSLNPIGDKFRSVSDRIARSVTQLANQAIRDATSQVNELYPDRFRKSKKQQYKNAKALLYSLKKYKELIYAAEIHETGGNYAVVASGHAASAMIEYGGMDEVLLAGDQPLVYPALHLLGRSMT